MKLAELANHIIDRAIAPSSGRLRYIVAIAGPPGSGKSTLAGQLLSQLKSQGTAAKTIPMDGFHLDNSILTARGLLERKGAPQTFDASGFVHLIKRLANGEADVVIPTFDRQRDIAIAGSECVAVDDKILLVEGNYLLLESTPWSQLHESWDETIFLNPGLDVIQQRLVDRWLDHGLTPEKARVRAMENDIPNAQYVLQHSAVGNITISK